jgi:hypothetical protein
VEFGCKNDNFGFEKSNQTIRANLDKPKIAKELYEEFNVCWGSLLSGRPHWFLGKICQSVSNLKNQITFDKKCWCAWKDKGMEKVMKKFYRKIIIYYSY